MKACSIRQSIFACKVFRGKGTAEELRHRMAAAVQAEYPEQEPHLAEHARQRTIPASMLEVLEESQTAHDNDAEAATSSRTPAGPAPPTTPKSPQRAPGAALSQTSAAPAVASSQASAAGAVAGTIDTIPAHQMQTQTNTCLTPQPPAPPRRSQPTPITFSHSLSEKRDCSDYVDSGVNVFRLSDVSVLRNQNSRSLRDYVQNICTQETSQVCFSYEARHAR